MVTSFADGSKISFEQSIVANATGFKVRSRGMSRGLHYTGDVLKIGEGQSPRPMDRVYYNFNGYVNVNKDAWTDPTQPIRQVNLYRSVFGLEKTFFDGQVSLGVRVPFYTTDIETKDVYLQPTHTCTDGHTAESPR